jgi:hypothetical protein
VHHDLHGQRRWCAATALGNLYDKDSMSTAANRAHAPLQADAWRALDPPRQGLSLIDRGLKVVLGLLDRAAAVVAPHITRYFAEPVLLLHLRLQEGLCLGPAGHAGGACSKPLAPRGLPAQAARH